MKPRKPKLTLHESPEKDWKAMVQSLPPQHLRDLKVSAKKHHRTVEEEMLRILIWYRTELELDPALAQSINRERKNKAKKRLRVV